MCELAAYSTLTVHVVMEAARGLVAVLFWICICSTSGNGLTTASSLADSETFQRPVLLRPRIHNLLYLSP